MHLTDLQTFNLAIIVLFIGKWLTERVPVLGRYNIPEPVSSGLLVCGFTALIHAVFKVEISFDLAARDILLVYFSPGSG